MQVNTISLFVLLCGILSAAIAVFAWRRRSINGAFWFALFMLGESVYILGYSLELSSLTLPGMLFWNKIQYFGILSFPTLYMIFTLQYSHQERVITRRNLILFFLLPVIILLIKLSDDSLHLHYKTVAIDLTGQVPLLAFTAGPLYLVSAGYNLLMITAGNIILWRRRRFSSSLYLQQTYIILAVSTFLYLIQVIYLSGYRPFPFLQNLDFNAIFYPAWGLAIAWTIFRYRLFDLVPIAREKLIETLPEGVLVFDGSGRLVDANPASKSIFSWKEIPNGWGVDKIFNGWRSVSAPESAIDQSAFRGSGTIEVKNEIDGRTAWYEITMTDLGGQVGEIDGRLFVIHEITSRKMIEGQLRDLSLEDELTRLKNRRGFFTLASQMMEMIYRMNLSTALIFMDLDVLKQINDRLGHAEGDRVISTFARLLLETCRSSDIVARVGGDEFIIFAVESKENSPDNIIARLQHLLDQFNESGEIEIKISFSYGIAPCRMENRCSLEELINEADQAMYRNKAEKRLNRP
jgi:diguanylate cyclase (GGDEF)-like protein